jgi:hypothetical protein
MKGYKRMPSEGNTALRCGRKMTDRSNKRQRSKRRGRRY